MRTKFLSGVAIMTLLASCETITFDYENEVDLKTPDGTFSAIIERQPVTRTTLSDNTNSSGYYTLSWNQGDEISIYDGENISVFTTDDNGTDTGIFRKKEGTVNYGAFSYTAFYPSSITATDMMLPAEQYYVEDNVKDFPMYAKSYSKELEFKNLCGIIRLALKSQETGSIEIATISLSSDNAGMSGEFTIGYDKAAVVSGTDGVVLTCNNPVKLYTSTETDFNIIVPQADYNPLKVKIRKSDGKEVNLVSEEEIHVDRSGITKITLTLGTSSFDSSLETIPITESDVEFTER